MRALPRQIVEVAAPAAPLLRKKTSQSSRAGARPSQPGIAHSHGRMRAHAAARSRIRATFVQQLPSLLLPAARLVDA